jgi:hypothetical protein
MKASWGVVPVIVVGILALGSCSTPGDEEPSPSPATSTETTPEPVDEPEPLQDSKAENEPQRVTYENVGWTVPGGWQVHYDDRVDDAEVPYAVYEEGYCETDPDLALARAFLHWTPESADTIEAVHAELERVAESGFPGREPRLEFADHQQVDNVIAVTAVIDMSPSDDPCDPRQAVIGTKAVAYRDGSTTMYFIVVGKHGLEGAPPQSEIIDIVSSFNNV